MSPGRRYTYGIDVDDRASSSMAKLAATARREMGKVQSELDDTGTSAQKAAHLLDAMADTMKVELEKAERASEALRTALGDVADRVNVTEALAKLRGLGVEFEDIEANADELAVSIKKLDGVVGNTASSMKSSLGDAADGLDRVSHSGDQSRSVLANLAGNATSELPGVATALGPVNVALGQLAEYAADGNIRLKSLIGLGLGAGAVVGILSGIAGSFEDIAKSKAFDKERVNSFRQAILDSGSAAEVLRDELAETGQIMVELGGTFGTIDIVPALDAAGLSVERFTELAGRSLEQIDAWSNAMRTAGVDAEVVDAITVGLVDTHGNLIDAEKAAAVTARLLGDETDETTQSFDRNNDRLQRSIELHNERNEAILSAADADLALRDAIDQADDALAEYNDAVNTAGASSEEAEDAGRNLEDAYYALGEAAAANAENQARAAGRSSTAVQEGVQAQVEKLYTLALNLAPGSPVRNAIEGHIQALLSIPSHRSTTVDVTLRQFNPTQGQQGRVVPVMDTGGVIPGRNGEPVPMIGHAGEVVLNAAQQENVAAAMSGGGSKGGGGITVNVTAGFGADGDDIANKIVDILTRWQRSNGSLPWAS